MSKKKKKSKKSKAVAILGFFEFIFALAIIVMVIVGFSYFFCGLNSVTMTGTNLYDQTFFEEAVKTGRYPDNTVYVFFKNKIFPVKDIQFIEKVDVKMTGLNSIEIDVAEKPIMGYITATDGSFVYYDYDGVITEISTRFVEGHLRVDGLISQEPVIGNLLDVDEDTVSFLLTLTKLLEKYELNPNEIDFNEKGQARLLFDDYEIIVGNASYLEEKISRVPYVLPSIEGYHGILHLENFSMDNTDIVFEKNE